MAACDAVRWTVIEIDNAHPDRAFEQRCDGPVAEFVVGGDNTHGEFTGWDKGWRTVQSRLRGRFDIVVIANDALKNSKPYRQIHRIDSGLLRALPRSRGVIGWLDSYVDVSPAPLDLVSTPMNIFGSDARWWVCTTFIVFSRRVFESVFPLTNFDSIDPVYFDAYAGAAFRPDCGLNAQYREFLTTHQARVWYRKYELNADTYPLFRAKTSMIVNEHLIGTRIAAARARVIDLKVLDKPLGRRDEFMRGVPVPDVRFRHLSALTRRVLEEKIRRAAEKSSMPGTATAG
jgi:hypothetical protein